MSMNSSEAFLSKIALGEVEIAYGIKYLAADLYGRYCMWCKAAGERTHTQRKFCGYATKSEALVKGRDSHGVHYSLS
jgi:hypothetical protein